MKHLIIVKFKDSVSEDDKEKMYPEIEKLFANLTSISGMNGVKVYKNCIDRPNRSDIIIEIDMEKEALSLYDESSWHRLWKEKYSSLIEKKAIFDTEDY